MNFVIIGESQSGKTSFIRQISKKKFSDQEEEEEEEFQERETLGLDITKAKFYKQEENGVLQDGLVSFLEIGGRMEYSFIQQFLKNKQDTIHKVCIFFDINSEVSYYRLLDYLKIVGEDSQVDISKIVVIGNKFDENEKGNLEEVTEEIKGKLEKKGFDMQKLKVLIGSCNVPQKEYSINQIEGSLQDVNLDLEFWQQKIADNNAKQYVTKMHNFKRKCNIF